ncbi:MAG: DNA (cytosine-5-)-methyltransferase [Mycoplasmoidaceae bacterium]
MNNKIRVFEAFSGIGAQNKALKKINANYEIVGMAEWYLPAIVAYHAIHNNFKADNNNPKISYEEMIDYLKSKPLSNNSKSLLSLNYWNRKKRKELVFFYNIIKYSESKGNIFNIQELYKRGLKDVDLLTYSFPCQDLSQQGKSKGISKDIKSRSGLLWEIEKALDCCGKEDLPKYLLMENVVPLTYKNHKKELELWLKKLTKLGYKNDLKILNSSNFGASQSRRRTFMISSLNNQIQLPEGNIKPNKIKKILDKQIDSNTILKNLNKYKHSNFSLSKSNIRKFSLLNYTNFNSEAYVYDPEYTGPTLTASGANSRIKIYENNLIRKLSAKECVLYMGFDKKDYFRMKELGVLTQNNIIYLCGNSISIELLKNIMKIIYDNFLIYN